MRTMEQILSEATGRKIGKEGMPAEVIAAVIYVQALERLWDKIELQMSRQIELQMSRPSS